MLPAFMFRSKEMIFARLFLWLSQRKTETFAFVTLGGGDHDDVVNGPMLLIPMPAALLARRLRSILWRQKQVGIPERGRSPKICLA
jgi:hypothetical protein